MFFSLEKNVSPLPNGSFLEGYRCWWQFGREGFPSFCWPLKGNLFTDEAKCARFYVSEKNVSPLSCALLSRGVLCLALHVSNDGCRVQGEKRLPPFWHASFDFSEGVSDSYLRGQEFLRLGPQVSALDILKGRRFLAFVQHLLCFYFRRRFLVRIF